MRRLLWIVALLALLLCGCRKEMTAVSGGGAIDPDAPLVASAESQEQAQRIADTYGITLVSYDMGLATFCTEEDPQTVIQRGVDNGWPKLELNLSSKSS